MDSILKSYDHTSELLKVIEETKTEDYNIDEIHDELEKVFIELETGRQQEPEKEQPKPAVSKTKKQTASKTGTKKTAKKKEKPKPVEEKKESVKEEPAAAIEQEEPELGKNAADEVEEEKIEAAKPEQPKEIKKQTAAQTAVKKGDNTIRVDVNRLDDLLNFVQDLVLGRNRLSQINNEMSMQHEGTKLSRDLADTARQIDLMTTELQLAVMKTRMVKIGKVFNRFPRLVRDLSRDMQKEVALEIRGEETELDKTLIEEINDPLVHIVRNSCDHGLETPEERRLNNKDPKGTIILAAEHEGNNIIITVEDDGRGIDPEKIKAKAVSKGIISQEKANELSNKEVYNLLFAPGFSTAEKVTNVSGRGVGMDVVKTNVAKLRGIINVESEVGKGTKIIIKLPLTLAIIQGLLVDIGGETIVVPLNSVIEVVRLSKNEIYMVNQTECIKLRDQVHPLIDIDSALYGTKGNGHHNDFQFIVIVGIAEKRFGLKVDKLIGQNEVVIKSLGNYLGSIDGIAGSTIMGDGKVVMIADIAELVHKIMDKK
jgi:two-component system chemotaxis sensor kinase CheA